MRADGRLLLLLGSCLASGAAALVYETAWTQQFALSFGASEAALAAVLAAYMAGLTLGALVGARLVGRARRPVRAYALLELGVAASALGVPLALGLAERIQVRLLGDAGLLPHAGTLASVLFHLAAAFGILAIPTGLMGATLPLLVRFAVREEGQIGSRVGWLYTANTLGAAAGVLATAFLLLPRLGLGHAVLAGVALDVCAFLLAAPLAGAAVEADPGPPAAGPRGLILPLVLASSAVSFTCEVFWTRLLTFALGASLYALGAMLATFLLGISLGSALASRFCSGAVAARRGFALAQVGMAVGSFAAFHAADRLPGIASALAAPGSGFLVAGACLSILTLLPGATCAGATYPFAVRLLSGNAAEAGAASARVYAWSTFGAVIGAILGGLVLLPALRFEGAIAVACATSLALAAAAALLGRPLLRSPLALAGAGLAGLVAWPAGAPLELLRHSTLPGQWNGLVVYYGVGRSATVLMLEQGWEWRLTSNGLPESAIQAPGARPSRYAAAHWLSLLALAARPEARSLLVVGLGAGKSVEDVPPSVATLDVVELEPEIVAANRAVSGLRREDPLSDPRLRLRLDDARSALLLTGRRFDAVVSQPSHPWTAGSAPLFSREFFELVRERLSEDGVLVQWIGVQFVDEALLRSLLATLQSVFPHVEVYAPPPGGSLLFLASSQPLAVAATASRAIAAAPEIWAAQGVFGPEDLLVARVQDEAGVARVAAGAPLVTDQRNLLQTRSPLALSRPLGTRGTDRLFAPFDPLRREAGGQEAGYLVRRLIRDGRLPRARRLAEAMPEGVGRRVALGLVDLAAGQVLRGDRALAAAALDGPGEPAALHALLLRRGPALVAGLDPDDLLRRLREDPLALALIQGWRLQRSGRPAAIQALETTLALAGPHDDLFEPALRLRLAWRLAAGDRERAGEALALLDPFLATGATVGDLLLRARLGALAGQPGTLLASLHEVSEATGPDRRASAREGLSLFEELPAALRGDPRAGRVRSRLKEQTSGGSVTPEADAAP